MTKIRKIQEKAAEILPHAILVDTDDLNGRRNGIHATKEGYKVLGKRFADAAIELINDRKQNKVKVISNSKQTIHNVNRHLYLAELFMKNRILIILVISSICTTLAAEDRQYSNLWGKNGEKFDPAGRLFDWSYAGYRAGEKELPTLKPTAVLTNFGAVANDGKDDTVAFEKALKATRKGGCIRIPAGTFILKKAIQLPNGVVLQGAGRDKTKINIPVSLTDVYGNKGLQKKRHSSYAFSGSFIKVKGEIGGNILGKVTKNGISFPWLSFTRTEYRSSESSSKMNFFTISISTVIFKIGK